MIAAYAESISAYTANTPQSNKESTMNKFVNIDSSKRPQKVHVDFTMLKIDDSDAGLDYEMSRERRNAFKRGNWGFVGIRAIAELMIPIGGNSFRMMSLESAGLWGIESDSDESYFLEVYQDEKRELIEQIATLSGALASGDYVTNEPEAMPARAPRYTAESCPSKHNNNGQDVCSDCGVNLN